MSKTTVALCAVEHRTGLSQSGYALLLVVHQSGSSCSGYSGATSITTDHIAVKVVLPLWLQNYF
jgi:hypothetical protein